MDHLQVWELEKTSEGTNAWDRWCAKVEKSAGDLDSWAEEFSLVDHAYAAFRAGLSVNDYLSTVHDLTDIYANAGPAEAKAHMLAQYHEWREARFNQSQFGVGA